MIAVVIAILTYTFTYISRFMSTVATATGIIRFVITVTTTATGAILGHGTMTPGIHTTGTTTVHTHVTSTLLNG